MGTATGLHPRRDDLEAQVPASATGVTTNVVVGRMPYAGVVEAVEYTPVAAIAGADTNTRRLRLIDRGTNGAGTDVVAELSFTSGVNGVAFDAKTITLQGADGAAIRDVAEGAVLALESAAVGTGLADPGGHLRVRVSRD